MLFSSSSVTSGVGVEGVEHGQVTGDELVEALPSGVLIAGAVHATVGQPQEQDRDPAVAFGLSDGEGEPVSQLNRPVVPWARCAAHGVVRRTDARLAIRRVRRIARPRIGAREEQRAQALPIVERLLEGRVGEDEIVVVVRPERDHRTGRAGRVDQLQRRREDGSVGVGPRRIARDHCLRSRRTAPSMRSSRGRRPPTGTDPEGACPGWRDPRPPDLRTPWPSRRSGHR